MEAKGLVNLANNSLGGFHVAAQLLTPGTIAPGATGRDIALDAVLDGPVATLFADFDENAGLRPGYKLKLNSYDLGVDIELADAVNRIRFERPEVRAVVISSARERVFCSGADLAAAGTGSVGDSGAAIMALLRLIVDLPKPVIGRIAGHVRAGGMGIVGACDLAVAAEGASFAFTEARIGLAPAMISLTTLDIMDPRQSARYYLTGETFGAPAAAQTGLVTVACAADELDSVVDGLVAQVLQTSPQGAAETKKLLNLPRRQRLDALGPELAELSAQLFASDEAQESIRAFLEKRAPAWRSS